MRIYCRIEFDNKIELKYVLIYEASAVTGRPHHLLLRNCSPAEIMKLT